MAKKYYENSLIRFLYWPKKALMGNRYHYINDEVENSPASHQHNEASPLISNQAKRYHEVKLPKSNLFSRFVALILYPIFTPLAFCLSTVTNLFFRKDYSALQKEIKEDKKQGKTYKKAIRNKLNLDADLDVQETLNNFDEKQNKLREKWANLHRTLRSTDAWEKEENIAEFNKIFIKTSKHFPLLLSAMKVTLDREKLAQESQNKKTLSRNDSQAIANRIVIQAQNLEGVDVDKPAFSSRFVNSILFDMYHFARTKAFLKTASVCKQKDNPEGLYTAFPTQNMRKHENAQNFYTRGTPEYLWRQGFNTNIKLFYGLFGGEKFRTPLQKADNRFDEWTRVDTSKNESSFLPYPTSGF